MPKFYVSFAAASNKGKGVHEVIAPDETTVRNYIATCPEFNRWFTVYSEKQWESADLRQFFPEGVFASTTVDKLEVIAIDLDNCIADNEWRLNYIDNSLTGAEKYEAFHLLCGFDDTANHFLFRDSSSIVVLTARPEKVRVITEKWLQQNGISVLRLMMRPEGDCRPAVDVKRDQLREIQKTFAVTDAFDDRPEIVEMYREEGIRSNVVYIYKRDGNESNHL